MESRGRDKRGREGEEKRERERERMKAEAELGNRMVQDRQREFYVISKADKQNPSLNIVPFKRDQYSTSFSQNVAFSA